MNLLWAKGLFLALILSLLTFWHWTLSSSAIHRAEDKVRATQALSLSSALLAQKAENDRNQTLLKDHIALLAKARNAQLISQAAVARTTLANSTSLDSLLDSIAKSDSSCRAQFPLPISTSARPNSPPPAATPEQLFPVCAKALFRMAEDADALSARILSLQSYTESLTPFFHD